jgi:hypothetical protein
MKIPGKKRVGAIISTEWFIILAAVLTVGGLATATAMGLFSSAASTNPLSLTSYSVASTGQAISMTVKNVGASTFSFGTNTAIAITGASATTTTATCASPTVYVGGSSGGTWTVKSQQAGSWAACAAAAITGFQYTGPSSAVTLPPGQSLVFNVALAMTYTSGSFPTAGNTYTITINTPTQIITQSVTSS